MKTLSEMKASLPKPVQVVKSYADLPVQGVKWDKGDLKALLEDETGKKVDLDDHQWRTVELPYLRWKCRDHQPSCNCIDCATVDAWDRNEGDTDTDDVTAKLAQLGPCGRESVFYPGFTCIKPCGHKGNCCMEEVSDGIKTTIQIPNEEDTSAAATVDVVTDQELEESLTNALSLLGRVNDMFEFIGRKKLGKIVTPKERMIVEELDNDIACFLNDMEKQ